MKQKKLLIITVIVAIIGSIGCINYQINVNKVVENESKISIRYLEDINNEDGTVTKKFSYGFQPQNVTYKEILIDLKYEDGSECDDVIEYVLDDVNHHIYVSCKKEFDKKINLKIISKMNKDISATVVIDYLKKINSLSFNRYANYGPGGNSDVESFSEGMFFNVGYSKYTKDYQYKFKVDNVKLTFNDNVDYGLFPQFNEYMQGENELVNLLERCIKDLDDLPTNEELWNCIQDEWWKEYLYNASYYDNYFNKKMGLLFSLDYKISCIDDPKWYIEDTGAEFNLILGDYSYKEFYVYPEQVMIECDTFYF